MRGKDIVALNVAHGVRITPAYAGKRTIRKSTAPTQGYLCLASNRAIRGYNSARNWNNNNATNSNPNLGFRPAL